MGSTKIVETMIGDYLNQGEKYYSASKNAMLTISEMVPAHRANAAEAMLRDAVRWLTDAGRELTCPMSQISETAVFRALRAEAKAEARVIAIIDSDGDRWALDYVTGYFWMQGSEHIEPRSQAAVEREFGPVRLIREQA